MSCNRQAECPAQYMIDFIVENSDLLFSLPFWPTDRVHSRHLSAWVNEKRTTDTFHAFFTGGNCNRPGHCKGPTGSQSSLIHFSANRFIGSRRWTAMPREHCKTFQGRELDGWTNWPLPTFHLYLEKKNKTTTYCSSGFSIYILSHMSMQNFISVICMVQGECYIIRFL